MKLQLEILKIKCLRTTAEIGADEIYSGVYFFKGDKVGDDFIPDKTSLQVKISDIESGVKKGDIWKPIKNKFEFDLNESKLFGLKFCLFDKDDSSIYNKLETGDVEAAKNAFNIGGLQYPKDPTNAADWVVPVLKLIGELYKFTKQDDKIGTEPFAYQLDNPNLGIAKSFELKRLFAHYEIIINLSLIS